MGHFYNNYYGKRQDRIGNCEIELITTMEKRQDIKFVTSISKYG